jgi:hypothetical protein
MALALIICTFSVLFLFALAAMHIFADPTRIDEEEVRRIKREQGWYL